MDDLDVLRNNIYIESEISKQKFVTFVLIIYIIDIYLVTQIYIKYVNELLLGLCIFISLNFYIHIGLLIIAQKIKNKYVSERLRLLESRNRYIRNSETEIIKKILIKKFNYIENEKCLICLENNCNIKILCNHKYCAECLSGWIKKNNKCPMCRKLIIDNLVNEINIEKKDN